jgi:hypothetical protein
MPKSKTIKRTVDFGKLLQECTDTLVLWDGESVAEKAEEILGHPVKYIGDSLFEVMED